MACGRASPECPRYKYLGGVRNAATMIATMITEGEQASLGYDPEWASDFAE